MWCDMSTEDESSLRKFMNVSDMQVADEDDHNDIVSQQTIKANNRDRLRTNLDQSCHQRDNVTALGARH